MKKIVILVIPILLLCGCNYNVIDLEYQYNEAVCDYNGNKFKLKIDRWTDYDGEQIQIESNGKIYLISANNCYLVGN